MPIPNLTRIPGGVLHSYGVGVPVNGNNTFQLGIEDYLVDPTWLRFFVIARGPSVQSAGDATYDANTGAVTIPIVQLGADEVRIDAWVEYSAGR
jgi:hypothetical protein